MGRLLAPKDATQRFGVSAETLRRWEREGRIAPTERTMGGQRRYDEDDIARLMESGARRVGPTPPLPSALPPTPQPDEPPRTAPLASPELPAWERRVRWAEAGLAVDKVKRERLALRREVHEEREKREREAKQAEHMAKLAAERAAAAEADARRLARLR